VKEVQEIPAVVKKEETGKICREIRHSNKSKYSTRCWAF